MKPVRGKPRLKKLARIKHRLKKSAFDEWFSSQFGEEPDPSIPFYELQGLEIKARQAAYNLKARIEARQLWLTRQQAALYAWQVVIEKKP